MVNKVFLLGRLGADPEVRYAATGTAIATFRMATSERFMDQNGDLQERTEWHRVVTFGKLAETCSSHLSKGSLVFVEGRLQTRTWETETGERRSTTEIVAQNVRFLPNGKRDQANSQESLNPESPPEPEEDLPF